MLTLKTGVPGSGKTLTAVAEYAQLAAREDFNRPVFVHGIPDLALPYIPLPVFNPCKDVNKRDSGFTRSWEVVWDEVPSGSLVIIDEAQQLFPVRAAGSAVPGYVAFLNVHRHRGIDLVLITQHPKLIDTAVRKLVGKHQHYRRILGMQRHLVYEWDSCSDSVTNLKTATFSQQAFPRKAFAAYKSAEIHTKQKFAIPYVLAVPVLAVGVLGFVGVKLFGYYRQGGISSVAHVAPGGAAPASAPVQVAAASAPAVAAPVAALAASAVVGAAPGLAVGDGYVTARNTWPASIAGCWSYGSVCKCTTNEVPARVIDVPKLCAAVAFGTLGPSPFRPVPTAAVAANRPPEAIESAKPLPAPVKADASEARPA